MAKTNATKKSDSKGRASAIGSNGRASANGANGRTSGSNGRVEGEGSYSATRAYNKNLARAVSDKGSIERGAERARRALEGAEGPSLREAERRAKGGPRPRAARAR